MRVSNDGLDRLERREGVVLEMYRDSAGLPTIGVGHLLTRDELRSGKLTALGVDWRDGITRDECDALLEHDLTGAMNAVNAAVTVPLTQRQFDTLTSFAFNVGTDAFRHSTLLRLLNAGEYDAVPGQLRRWIYSAGEKDQVLVNRRASEIEQWTTP